MKTNMLTKEKGKAILKNMLSMKKMWLENTSTTAVQNMEKQGVVFAKLR
jgi:hypothetical protein